MRVEINDKVTFLLNGRERTCIIINGGFGDVADGKISTNAPLARFMLGREEGDVLHCQVPIGRVEIKIKKVEKGI